MDGTHAHALMVMVHGHHHSLPRSLGGGTTPKKRIHECQKVFFSSMQNRCTSTFDCRGEKIWRARTYYYPISHADSMHDACHDDVR